MKALNIEEKQSVSYAIPLWLRDEQIKHSITRVRGRITPHDRRAEPCAIVGFGPSLKDTWEKIREFKYVFSCSGSHKFLIERDIIPTWHVEVDPRPHKIALLGEPCPDVIYLPSSTTHPEYFNHLEKHLGAEKFESNVLLWHVFDSTEDGQRILPRGEWCLTGGCDVGMRALTIAAFLGFRELHCFGFDGNARDDGKRHAAEHPNTPKEYSVTSYNGVEYKTTPAMLEAARQIWHEFDQMPMVRATFYGDGLIQEMAKNYVFKEPIETDIALSQPELISANYRDLNSQLHKENLAYGVGGDKHTDMVIQMVNALKKTSETIPSVLDYGAGKGRLAASLSFPIAEYDPAFPEKAAMPRSADIVICTDVLEHIEPDKLLFVLDHLRQLVKQIGYFVIHTGPAHKTLPDGRNTHLIQQEKQWWKNRLKVFFNIGKMIQVGPLLYVWVVPKKIKVKKREEEVVYAHV